MHSFIHQWLYSPLLGPGLFFSSVIFLTQTVGLLGRVIGPSQGRYIHTGHTNAHTDIHALSGGYIYSDRNYYVTIWIGFIWLGQCIFPDSCELSDRRIP
jgi:hypothetical protein